MQRALALVAATLVAGCADDPGTDGAVDEVRRIGQQFAAGDPAVCARFTKRFLRDSGIGGTVRECKRAARRGDRESQMRVETVTVDGDRARVEIDDSAGQVTLYLARRSGWVVDSADFPGD